MAASTATEPTKVTILSSSYGGGHEMVAKTVRNAILERRPDWQIEVRDFFEDFVGGRFNRVVQTAYLQSVRRAPYAYGFFYRVTQKIGEGNKLQRHLNRVGRKRLLAYVREHSPDLVVSTYPTPSGVLASLKADGLLDVPSATIMTDFAEHSQWLHSGVDLYIVGCDRLREGIIERGIRPDHALATGIPVRPGFRPPEERPEKAPVLVTVGAVGMLKGSAKLVRALVEVVPKLVVICGHDQPLLEKLQPVAEAYPGRLKLHGFVDNMHEYMASSRMLVGKPGGITSSEALAVGLPIVIIAAIPGQEEENERFLLSEGAAVAPGGIPEVCAEAQRLLDAPEELEAMSQRAAALGKPESAADAAEALIDLREGRRPRVPL